MPALVELLNPIALIATAILAYWFGKAQGRDQVRQQESTKVLIELRRRIIDARAAFPYPLLDQESPFDVIPANRFLTKLRGTAFLQRLEIPVWLVLVSNKMQGLLDYYEANSPLIMPEVHDKISPVLTRLTEQVRLMVEAGGYYPRDSESTNRFSRDLEKILGELDEEIRKYVGTAARTTRGGRIQALKERFRG
jgi:hypothetical protein